MKTYSVKAADIKREWHVIDASEQVLGKLATRAAALLIGKHKPVFSRHLDVGDYVVVINAEKVRVTGNKVQQKVYYRHTGYPGGLKETTYEQMMQKNPEEVFRLAVRRMLPKTRLGRKMFKKLHVYAGPEHPHKAQKPEPLKLN